MKKIAVDIDDVISPFGESFIRYHNKTYGTNFSVNQFMAEGDWKGYYEQSICRLLEDPNGFNTYRTRFEDYLITDNHASGQPILEETKRCLKELKKNYNLVVITARDHALREKTVGWLNKELSGIFNDVYFVSNWRHNETTTKAEVCVSIKAEYLIDDNVDHCNTAAIAGIQPILFGGYGWNKHHNTHENVIRLDTWTEVLDFFQKKT